MLIILVQVRTTMPAAALVLVIIEARCPSRVYQGAHARADGVSNTITTARLIYAWRSQETSSSLTSILALAVGSLHLRHRRAGHQDSINDGEQGSGVAPPARHRRPPPRLGPAAGGTAAPLVATSLAPPSSSSSPQVCTTPATTSPSSSSSSAPRRRRPRHRLRLPYRLHQAVRRLEFMINDDDCRTAISITHTTPASEPAACGGVPASASRCHATDVVAVEHLGVDPMAPILLAGNSG